MASRVGIVHWGKRRLVVVALVFRTPATKEIPRTLPDRIRDRFWSRFQAPRIGVAVLKQPDGSYLEIEEPTKGQVRAATTVYWGGYRNEVSEAEAEALQTAGYTISEE